MFYYLTVAIAIVSFVPFSYCFCIYNFYTDGTLVDVKQESEVWAFAEPFSVEGLQPGDSACCHYTNKDCNLHGEQTAMVTFGVGYQNRFKYSKIKLRPAEGYGQMYRVDTSAGGTIQFTGDMNNNSIAAYSYDNTFLSSNPRPIIVEYIA
ncbi:hypothetical protein PHYBLDRAFT_69688 [Phycomyces blakesleeanus NRRL 1555(-)]|uniref:Uncharacterized protein n=1 Tax=Phycomyces blakesleeanus (strain ATCC 8743b / DSM 1359 / FGSC 10004 / NBRC 33097 / NRRL 1555) TaxID=763407 RepID=A0A162Y5C4_PHYB8|nr:hypothetical protein PHYBLDRAFT_69688 [Phycomyces blakesleeanus NRRL 1555(-)]OAD78365.1 hypothetical protein PHYBLDRAFT_69688 [Phycomyces blakesleeanus NRRL 1555(-)]|eukprot:XP_018296405.1 hypothetical protein PHYBLDRAFT_69688 [Phycomyces blakesleeanus NRRL 1555(-)]